MSDEGAPKQQQQHQAPPESVEHLKQALQVRERQRACEGEKKHTADSNGGGTS